MVLKTIIMAAGGLIYTATLWPVIAHKSFSLFLRLVLLIFVLSTYGVTLSLLAILFGNESEWVKAAFLGSIATLFLCLVLAVFERASCGKLRSEHLDELPPADEPASVGFEPF